MHSSPFAAAYRLPSRPPASEPALSRPTFRRPRIFGRGRLEAAGVVVPVESRTVVQWLPRGVRLGQQNLVASGAHPVVILFGHQQSVQLNLLPCLRLTYRELRVVVPYTRVEGEAGDYLGPFTCPVALYHDRGLPKLLSRIYWTAPRAGVRFARGVGQRRICRRDGRLLAELTVFQEMAPGHESSPAAVERARLIHILQQPNVAHRSSRHRGFFGVDWGIADARIRALDAKLTVGQGLVSPNGWRLNRVDAHGLRPSAWSRLRRAGEGVAFRLETRWLLGLPEKHSPALSRWRAGGGLER